MNKTDLKELIKECICEVLAEQQDVFINVPGYAVVNANNAKQRIIREIETALKAARNDDWKTVNSIIGKGERVIPSIITSLSDSLDGKGIVSHNEDGSVKSISQ